MTAVFSPVRWPRPRRCCCCPRCCCLDQVVQRAGRRMGGARASSPWEGKSRRLRELRVSDFFSLLGGGGFFSSMHAFPRSFIARARRCSGGRNKRPF